MNAGMCLDKHNVKNAPQSPDNNAKMFPGRNARMFPGNNAKMFPGKWPDKNAKMSPDNNAEVYLKKFVKMSQDNNVKTLLVKFAINNLAMVVKWLTGVSTASAILLPMPSFKILLQPKLAVQNKATIKIVNPILDCTKNRYFTTLISILFLDYLSVNLFTGFL